MSRRYALVIGNSQYDDLSLSRLKTPEADVHALATALRDGRIGNFDDVQEMINQPEASVRRAISSFFLQKKSDDLLLLYFSGHGVLDAQGRLFLAVKDTLRQLLNATAIPSGFITDEMDACRSKRQILILDCCHSGAFSKGSKGDTRAITATTFEGNGYGRVVLTASDSTQYALEGDQVIEQASFSLFTNYLLEGLTSGEADLAQDGLITLDEWYDYAYDRVVSETPEQTPRKWVYNQQGELVIARNPNPPQPKPAELPGELKLAIESPFVGVRFDAVEELKRLLSSGNPALAQVAYQALKRVAENDDSKSIANEAQEAVERYAQEHPQLFEEGEQERTKTSLPPIDLQEQEKLAEEEERQRLEAERQLAERAAAEKAEAERIARQRAEAERLARERDRRQRGVKEETREKPRAAEGINFSAELGQRQVGSGETLQVIVRYPPGAEPAPVRISFSDPAGALSFTQVGPIQSQAPGTVKGDALTMSYRLALRRPVWLGKPQTYPFTVEVAHQNGETQALAGEALVRPTLPLWALPALGVLLFCLLAGWGLSLLLPRWFAPSAADSAATPTPTSPLQASATLQPSLQVIAPLVVPTLAVATHTTPAPARLLAFTSNRDGNWEIYLMEEESGRLSRLTENLADDGYPVWSPDGSKILFHSNRNGNYDLFVMNPDGSGLIQLTSDPRADTFASWSPDGRKIVFTSKRDGNRQIYLMNADGSGQRRLVHSQVDDATPSWSPDGRQILYATPVDGVQRLATINVDGSGQRLLTHLDDDVANGSFSFPVWSPDGARIAAVYSPAEGEEAIVLFDYTDGAVDFWYMLGPTGSRYTHPRWSPDGQTIYLASDVNGNFDIFRMGADGDKLAWIVVDPSDDEFPSVWP